MFNLLTEQAKKGAAREYRMRLMIVSYAFICAELLLAASGGILSFTALRAEGKHLGSVSDALHSARALADEAALLGEVKTTKARLALLAPSSAVSSADAVSAFAFLRTKGIRLAAIGAAPRPGGGWTISTSGVAATRDALAAFERAVKADSRFSETDFPLGSFAKEKDITFTVNVVYRGESLSL